MNCKPNPLYGKDNNKNIIFWCLYCRGEMGYDEKRKCKSKKKLIPKHDNPAKREYEEAMKRAEAEVHCTYCWDKGYHSYLLSTTTAANFIGDKAYTDPPRILKIDCKKCKKQSKNTQLDRLLLCGECGFEEGHGLTCKRGASQKVKDEYGDVVKKLSEAPYTMDNAIRDLCDVSVTGGVDKAKCREIMEWLLLSEHHELIYEARRDGEKRGLEKSQHVLDTMMEEARSERDREIIPQIDAWVRELITGSDIPPEEANPILEDWYNFINHLTSEDNQ